MKENKKEPLSVTEAARIKGCTRQTIYNNLGSFNLTPKGRIEDDSKFAAWTIDPRGNKKAVRE